MPKEVKGLFRDEVAREKTAILINIYGQKPNVYLASLAEFGDPSSDQPFILGIGHEEFSRVYPASCDEI